MISELEKNGYLIIRNFISIEKSKKLSEEFINYSKNNNLSSDTMVPNTPSKYNHIPFLELLCEKTPNVSQLISETVLPSYCYARIYKHDDILEKHIDRAACEISLTVHLDGDKEWEFYIQTPCGEESSVILGSGDALVYLGCEVPHWRNNYTGEYYTQVFLHYVRSRGKKFNSYFDNKNIINPIENCNVTSKLSDYIILFENIMDYDLCEKLILEHDNEDLEQSRIFGGIVDTSARNCVTINTSQNSYIEKNYQIRKELDNQIFDATKKIINSLIKKFPYLIVSKDSGYNFLKYVEGGFYCEHTDSSINDPRELSCSFILNDDYEGGEFAFFNRELKYKLKKGSAIVFPSNFMFPHEIMPVTKGTRYSIITWFT